MSRGRPRVALLGNMNNNHFSLARHLRDHGVDAHVLLFDRTPEHFRPECDTFADDHEGFVHQLGWGSVQRYPFTSRRRIRRDLAPYDVLIGCGAAPAYCHKAGRRLHVFIPLGGDLWNYTGRRPGDLRALVKYAAVVRAQRAGIRDCDVFHMTATNELYEGQWRRFRGRSQRWYDGLPMVYAPGYTVRYPQESGALARFRAIRRDADLMLFSSVRHEWTCDPRAPQAKGTRRLLEGLALFRERNPDCRVVLATFEYGSDVDASQRLVARLGLEDAVAWLPRMDRKDLMAGLEMADLACAEFENSWLASGVLYEALALGRPVLAHRDDDSYADQQPLYPILNAREPEQVADRLEEAWRDPSLRERLGAEGRAWYDERVVAGPVRRYVELIQRYGAD